MKHFAFFIYFVCGLLFIGCLFRWEPVRASQTQEDSLRRVLLRAENDLEKIRILNQLCRTARGDGDIPLRYARQMLNLSKELKEPLKSFHLSNSYGWLAEKFGEQNKFDSARKYLHQSLLIAEKHPKSLMWAFARERSGKLELEEGNWENAIEQLLITLPLWEQINQETEPLGYYRQNLNDEGQMRVCSYLAQAYLQLGQAAEAEKYLSRARELVKQVVVGKDEEEMRIRLLSAELAFDLNRYDTALKEYQMVLNRATKVKDPGLEAKVRLRLSRFYARTADYTRALQFGNDYLRLTEAAKDPLGTCSALLNLGRIYLQKGDYSEAQKNAQAVLDKGREVKFAKEIIEAYPILAECAEREGETASAYQYLLSYQKLREGTYDKDAADKVRRLQQSYQNEKNARELAIQEKKLAVSSSRNWEQTVFVNSILVGVLLLGAVIFLVYTRYRKHQKNNSLLSELNRNIHARNEELFTAQEELNATYSQIVAQRDILADKKRKVEESFEYARMIQGALLPLPNAIQSLPHSILYHPQDVITGDFYRLAEDRETKTVSASVADCIGSGVAPALMSLIGYHQLNFGFNLPDRPIELILKDCDAQLSRLVPYDDNREAGMELSVLKIEYQTGKMTCIGARLPVVILRKKTAQTEVLTPINILLGQNQKLNATPHERTLLPGDRVFLISNGVRFLFGEADSLGQALPSLTDYLRSSAHRTLENQISDLKTELHSRLQSSELTDDVIFIGIEMK